ncbi:putative alpha/beta hydrolase [Mycobacterium sp. ML4]
MAQLIAEAGGDPWAINGSLQSGRPAQISLLAKAFHDAAQLTTEAESAFSGALSRFKAAWNQENGDNPINDAAEVQRATGSLGVQAVQLPKIAVGLESVAATLAEAQRASAGRIGVLEGRLEQLDHQLDEAYALLNSHGLPMADEMALDDIIDDLEQDAIDETTAALHDVEHSRETYSEVLHRLLTQMRVEDGYDAAPVTAVDGIAPESPAQAEQDVHAALAGDQTAASRVNSVLNSITADQRAGRKPLTAEQAAVLSQLQAQQHGMSVDALQTAEQRLGDQREMIANSWQLMSNPALAFPRTELKPGAVQGTEVVKGSAAQLPEDVQRALTASGLIYAGDMNTIARIVKDGNPAFQRSTELDRGIIRKGSAMMRVPFWSLDRASQGENVGRDPWLDPLVSNVMSAVAPDHQVVHELLTGPDHDTFLGNVTHHFWSDNGQSIASLFDWTEAAAHGPEARLAAETARAYAAYVGEHAHDLLHLPGNHTLGEVNAGLVGGMAHGLAPYVNNIAGVSGGVPEFGSNLDCPDEGEKGTMTHAKGVFAVLGTNEAASTYFNGAADRQALFAESNYVLDLARHAPNMTTYNANLADAMTLRGLVDAGIHSAVQAGVENHHITETAAKSLEFDQRKTAYELGVKGFAAVAGFVPDVGRFADPAISMVGQAIESDVLGNPPTAWPVTDHPVPPMTIGRVDREILNAAIASGQHVEGISKYLINGHIASPDELERAHNPVLVSEYDHDLNQALVDLYTRVYGSVPGRPFIPDLDMINRYNAVVSDPLPPVPRPK